jgi:ankyrin repeat protein
MSRMSFLIFFCLLTLAQTVVAGALHDAAEKGDMQQVKALIKQGAAIDAKDEAGNTALHWAALSGNTELVKFLLDGGVPINATNDIGVTALILAEYGDNFEAAKLLVTRGAKLDIRDTDGATALSMAWEKGQRDFMQFLIQSGANPNFPAEAPLLHLLAMDGDDEMVAWFIQNGAVVDIRDRHGQTALHLAARRGYLPTVRALVIGGADVNARTIEKRTPLYLAVQYREIDTVQFLLDNGADVNAKTIEGDTPVLLAQRFSENFGETYPFELLKKYGGKAQPTRCVTEEDVQRMNRLSSSDRLVHYKNKDAKIFVEVVFLLEYESDTAIDPELYDAAVVWSLERRQLAPLVLFKDGCALKIDTGFIDLQHVKQLAEITDLINSNVSREKIISVVRKFSDNKNAIARFEKRLNELKIY